MMYEEKQFSCYLYDQMEDEQEALHPDNPRNFMDSLSPLISAIVSREAGTILYEDLADQFGSDYIDRMIRCGVLRREGQHVYLDTPVFLESDASVLADHFASAAGKISVNVKLKREDAAFLVPNQYVNYGKNDQVVGMSLKVCRDKDGKEAYTAIKKYITDNFRYDYVKAATIKPSVLPDIATCFTKKSGVCQDLSAVMVSMLRVQGIPARLVIGYADKIYHAWVVCEVEGKKVLFDPTAAVSKSKNAAKYSVERYY